MCIRDRVYCVFSLIDSRHNLQSVDLNFLNWLGEKSIPYCIVYTKTDKVKDTEIDTHIESLEAELLEHWEFLPKRFRTSTVKRTGGEDILTFIEEINNK